MLPSLKLNGYSEAERWAMTSDDEDKILEAVRNLFETKTITIYLGDKLLFQSYVCDDCCSKNRYKHKSSCLYGEELNY